jgi:pyruvate formate lyase activating enzyme
MKEGIRYVYVGNVPGHEGENTYCHNCKKTLIERNGYVLKQVNIKNGKCSFCGTAIPGRW